MTFEKPIDYQELNNLATELYGDWSGIEIENGQIFFCKYREEDGTPMEYGFTEDQMEDVVNKLIELGYNPEICGNKLLEQKEL